MMRPQVLILDEPVSQLDPIFARDFLFTLKKINEDFGLTIVLSEHRLDDVITIADRIIMLEDAHIVYQGTPIKVIKEIWDNKKPSHALFIPQIPKLSLTLNSDCEITFTPRQFKQNFNNINASKEDLKQSSNTEKETDTEKEKVVKIREISYTYDNGEYILKNLSLDIYKRQLVCILGGNGSGKSTLLKAIVGILVPQTGFIKVGTNKVGYIPQNLNTYFCTDTVKDEIDQSIKAGGLQEPVIQDILKSLDIALLRDAHPYDLSGGEQQKVVLASTLLRNPDIIVLDEPTKGMDMGAKTTMAKLLKSCGATVIIATHDIEFAAFYSDRCAMLFDGNISFVAPAREFFCESRYYTTAISRAVRHIWDRATLYKDVLELCEIEKPSFLSDF
jgi:energy-coupling factor transport system ATP-binding protein